MVSLVCSPLSELVLHHSRSKWQVMIVWEDVISKRGLHRAPSSHQIRREQHKNVVIIFEGKRILQDIYQNGTVGANGMYDHLLCARYYNN